MRPPFLRLGIVHFCAWILTVVSLEGANARLNQLPLQTSIADIAYDSFSRQLYVVTAPSNGVSRIAMLNQETVSLGPTLLEGQGAAVIEPDGIGGLYVGFLGSGTIVRHSLDAGTNSAPFSYGTGTSIESIRVVAPQDRLIAVARRHANPGFFDTTLFRDGIALTNRAMFHLVRGVEPGGEHVYSAVAGFHKLRVTTNGLELATSITNTAQGFSSDVTVRSNRVIFATGLITDLDLRPQATVIPSAGTQMVASSPVYADPRTNLLAFAWYQPLFGFAFILHDPVAGANIVEAGLPLPGLPLEFFPWGTNSYGVLWNDGGQGTLSIIDLQDVPESDLVLTMTASAAAATNKQAITFTLNLRNNGPDTAENVTVYNDLTFGLMLQTANASSGNAELWANGVTWRINALPAGELATLTVNSIATGPALSVSESVVTFRGVDPLPVNNTTTNTIPMNTEFDSGGLTVHLPTADMAANRETGEIYLTRISPDGPFPYSLLRWNPGTNGLEEVAAYPVAPKLLTLSKDNRYIFVDLPGLGEIDQIDLRGENAPVRFWSGIWSYVIDIDPLPDSPTSIVVGGGLTIGSRLFDNGVARTNLGPAGVIAVLNDTRAVHFNASHWKLNELLFTPEGISTTELPNQPVQGSYQISSAGGRVFVQNGMVLDPATGAVSETISTGVAPWWDFDEDADEFYILSHDNVKWTLKRYRLSTLTKLAEISVPSPQETISGFIKIGPGRFAYRTPSLVVLFTEPLLANADIAISSSITPSASVSSAEPFLWNLTITNRGPQTASNIVIIATVDGPALTLKPVEGKNAAYPNPFTRIVPILASGESHSLTLSVHPQSGGRFYLSARVERFGADSDFLNNTLTEQYSLAPAPGVIRSYRLPVGDIDFDKTSNRLLMTTGPVAKGLENSLVSLDLESYFLSQLFSFSAAPGLLASATAADSGFVNLESNTKSAQFDVDPPRLRDAFPIGSSISFDLLVRPGTTNVLAVSEWNGVTIYTNGVGSMIATPGAIAFDPQRPDSLFVYHDTGVLSRFDLGITSTIETSNRLTIGEIMPMVAVNGRVVFGNGQTADQETLQYLDRLPDVATNQPPGLVAVDEAAKRIFLYFHGATTDEILIFDAQSFRRMGRLVFDWTSKPVRFRAHNDRLALLDHSPNGFHLHQVRIFDIPDTNQVDLGALGTSTKVLEGTSTTLTANAWNSSPWVASNATVELQLPATFAIESVPGTNSYELVGNTIRFSLAEVISGATHSLQVVGKFTGIGTNITRGTISSDLPDLNSSDNQFEFTSTVVPNPTLIATNFTFIEGTPLQLRFTLSHPVPVPVRFTLTITNGTATVDQVLRPPANTTYPLMFVANSTNAGTQFIQSIANNVVDGPRSLTLLLSDGTNVNFEASTLNLNYLDDEGAPILSASSPQLMEGSTNRTFQVGFILAKLHTNEVRFEYRLVSETAIAGEDFSDASGVILMPAGVRTTNVAVIVLADQITEGPETLRLELSAPENVQFLSDMIRLTIREAQTPADQIIGVGMEDGRMTVLFTTTPQNAYRLVRSPDVNSTEWTPVGDLTLHSTGIAELTDPDPERAASERMFYRIEKQ